MNNNLDLFNNPMVESARLNMNAEQIQQYKKMGEQFYENFDFDTGTHAPADPVDLALIELKASLRSGLHPSCLTADEVEIMVNQCGENWMEKFGY